MKQADETTRQEAMDLLDEILEYREKSQDVWRQSETVIRRFQLIRTVGDLVGLLDAILAGEPLRPIPGQESDADDLPPELRGLVHRCQGIYARFFATTEALAAR